MKWFRIVCLAAVVGQCVGTGAAADRAANPEGPGTTPKSAPVLRPLEPADSGQVMLPGPPPAAPTPKPVTAQPAAKVAPPPAKRVEDAVLRRPLTPPVVPVAKSRSDTGRKATPANCWASPGATVRPTTRSIS